VPKQDKPQPIWDAIVAAKPQMFIFLGDNIYGDTEDMEVLRARYKLLGDQPRYWKLKRPVPCLRLSSVQVVTGTWPRSRSCRRTIRWVWATRCLT